MKFRKLKTARDLPPDIETWCRQSLVLPYSSARPGPIILEPWQSGFCKRFQEKPGVHALMCSSGAGKTTILNIITWWSLVFERYDMLLGLPTESVWLRDKKQKYLPFLRSNPLIAEELGLSQKDPLTTPTTLTRYSSMSVGWAGSPVTFQGQHLPRVIGDEIDMMYTGSQSKEDNPINNLLQRTINYYEIQRTLLASTPEDESISYIFDVFQRGDQAEIVHKCVHCKREDFFTFGNLNLEDEFLFCKLCEVPISESDRLKMLSNSHIESQTTPTSENYYSLHVSQMDSRFIPIKATIAAYKEQIWSMFSKSVLGQPYTIESTEKMTQDDLVSIYNHNKYADSVPDQVTIGGDLKKTELHYVVKGFYNGETHIRTLEAGVIERKNPTNPYDTTCWEMLYNIHRKYNSQMTFVDANYETDVVCSGLEYAFGSMVGRSVFPIKGDRQGTDSKITGFYNPNQSKFSATVKGVILNTDHIKLALYALYQDIKNPYLENPMSADPDMVNPDYTRHLISERRVTRNGKASWEPVYSGAPNHWFDCDVYAWGAKRFLGESKFMAIPV